MRFRYLNILILLAGIVPPAALSQDCTNSCKFAFNFITGEFAVDNTIKICTNSREIPYQYETEINMPVCDDTLCANVVLKLYWDLAGNFKEFDTIPGNPLTKIDHKKFDAADYLKLDQILRNRNSMLRILNREDLVDKSVKVKSTVVDAVTGATPKTIKNSVVEGAVYSSYTLWHFVNGAIKNGMTVFTQNIYSEPIAHQLLLSDNYDTQLFALRNFSEMDYEVQTDLLFQVIKQSVPLIKAYVISKAPLPFSNIEKNKQFVALFSKLDDYSKSIFLNRITTEENAANVILPLVFPLFGDLNKKQQELIAGACQKFEIPGFRELLEKNENRIINE